MNPYQELEVSNDASKQDIKAAYRRMAQKHHPDKNDGDDEKFKSVRLAYDVLGNDGRRKKFDETGSVEDIVNLGEKIINEVFSQMIEREIFSGDIIDKARKGIEKNRREVYHNVSKLRRLTLNLEKRKNRILRKDKSNLFEAILDSKIHEAKSSMEQFDEFIKSCDEAMLILESYQDSAPEIEAPKRYTGTNGSFTTSST